MYLVFILAVNTEQINFLAKFNTVHADKSLARQGIKQATTTEYFDFHISYL